LTKARREWETSAMSITKPASEVAFTRSVREAQARKGSRHVYEDAEWRIAITEDLVAFLAQQRSVFIATVNADGQPYIQHRGGPPGFLKVLDEHTIGFADLRGNRQYITTGNLKDNDRAHMFVIDYAHQRRVKIWGTARIVEDDPDLIASLAVEGYRGRPEQAFLFRVEAWDINCPQHIPQRFEAEDVQRILAERDRKIAALESEVATLRQQLAVSDACGDDGWDKVLKGG
jgi:uncharacterized protein